MSGFHHPDAAPRLLGAVTVVLTAAAGALDGVTFFAFNEVFASTMTGNLILLGLDIGRGAWLQTAEALCAIGGYIVGLAVGTLVAGIVMRRLPWLSAVGVALTVEFGLLLAVGVGYYGFLGPEQDAVRAVLLVTGSAMAMGIQAAALRYVGPAGTPTNFLTGTVTNWVSSMVELHKPKWDGGSFLRIVMVAVAAGVAAVVHDRAPSLTYVLPVALVGIAVVLMGRVIVLNHGGLRRGGPQFRDLSRLVEELEVESGGDRLDPSADGGAEGRIISGRVLGPGGEPVEAALTVLDPAGTFISRQTTDASGHYRMRARRPGAHTVVCTPLGSDAGPQASTVVLGRIPLVHDVVLADCPAS